MIPIESEGKLILENLKKKSGPIKDRIAIVFKKVEDYNKNVHKGSVTFPKEELSEVLLSLSDINNSKLHQSTLSIFQKLISLQLFPKENIPKLVSFLNALKNMEDDLLKLKMIQLLIPMSDSKLLDYCNLALIQNVYLIGFTEYTSKNKQLQTTSLAALFQISFMIFDTSLTSTSQLKIENNLSLHFHDLLTMIDGQLPRWVVNAGLKIDNPVILGLDIILALFKQCGQKIFANSQLSFLIEQKFFNFLKTNLTSTQPIVDFAWRNEHFLLRQLFNQSFKKLISTKIKRTKVLRMVRSIYFLLCYLDKSMDLVHFLITSLLYKENTLQIFLSLEVFNLLVATEDFLFRFYNYYQEKMPNYFVEFLVALVKNTEILAKIPEQELLKNDNIPKIRMSKLIEPSFTDVDIPPITFTMLTKLMVELLNVLVAELHRMSSKFNINLNSMEKKEVGEEALQYQTLIGQLWKSLFQCFSNLLRPSLPELQHLELSACIQTLVQVTGIIQINQARDKFLELLLDISLTKNGKLQNKNIQAMNRVMNIIHGMHEILDKNSWILILNNLCKFESIFAKTVSTLQKGSNSYASQQKKTLQDELGAEHKDTLIEIGIVAESEEKFFLKATTKFSINSIMAIIEAMVQTISQSSSKDVDEKLRKYSLDKLIQIIEINSHNLHMYWDHVSGCLEKLIAAPATKIIGVNYLCKAVLTGFKGQMSFKNEGKEWQSILLSTIYEVKIDGDLEVCSNLIELCINILQVGSFNLCDKAIQYVILISKKCLNENVGSSKMKVLDIIKGIINDYGEIIYLNDYKELNSLIREITSHTCKSIQLKNKFAKNIHKNLVDNNIFYQATGLVWKIADYVYKRQKKGESVENKDIYFDIWKSIFELLKYYAKETHSETRNSAINIFSSVLLDYGDSFSLDLWFLAFLNIFLQLVDDILEIYLNFAHENQISSSTENADISKEKGKEIASKLNAPKFIADIQTQFEDRARKNLENKMIHHFSRDSLEKHFEETLTSLIMNFTKLSKKFLLILLEKNQISSYPDVFQNLFGKIIFMQRMGKSDVYLEVLKSLREIINISNKNPIFGIKKQDILTILAETENTINRPPKEAKDFKFMVGKILPEILNLFADYLLISSKQSENQCDEQIFKLMVTVLKKCILYYESDEIFLKTKVASDEKVIYESLSKYPSAIILLNKQCQELFGNFILDELSLVMESKNNETKLKNVLRVFIKSPTEFAAIFASDQKNTQLFLVLLTKIISARGRKDSLSNETNEPIWVFASEVLQSLMKEFLVHIEDKFLFDSVSLVYETLIDSAIARNSTFHNLTPSLRKDYVAIDKCLMDILIQYVLPNASKLNIDDSRLEKLIEIVDKYFTSYSTYETTFSIDQNIKEVNEMASSVCSCCMKFMFKIANSETAHLNEEIGRIALKKLIFRCRNILYKYLRDERSSGNSLPRNRILEVLNIMQNLLDIEIPKNSIAITQVKEEVDVGSRLKVLVSNEKGKNLFLGKKGHLFYLYPCFIDMTGVNDITIKEKLQDLFTQIHKEIGGVIKF